MNASEIELLVNEAKIDLEANSTNWVTKLQEHINAFSKNGHANLDSEDDLTRLFDSEFVCSTGQANSTPIKDTLASVDFRKWFSQEVADLRLKEESQKLSIDEIIKFYDTSLDWFEKLSHNKTTKKPWLKLTRTLCALFPKYFTTIGNVQDLRKLYKVMFGNKAHDVEMHIAIKNKVQEILKETPAEDSIDFIRHLIIPWYMSARIKASTPDAEKNNTSKITGDEMIKDFPRNQILYGPPGTGKTFNTVNTAISIADPEFDLANSRKNVKERFDLLVEQGQIVFTTFHQNMSYEDFVEGIKPETLDGKVIYEIKPGIFKKICEDASTPNQLGFEAAYKKLQDELANLKEGELLTLTTSKNKEFSISLNSKGNLSLYTGADRNKQGVLTKENIQKQINGEKKFIGWESYFRGVLTYLKTTHGYSSETQEKPKNFVIIIDEINRGNVSQIFGELITLIEDDKRLGKAESIKVTLPYSKEEFGVPKNVYIIGTMNTADRSVEALDAALRRRFSFIEMPPKPDLIKDEGKLKDSKGILKFGETDQIDLPFLLRTINQRIEKLLDDDHQIGHSFFLSVDSMSSLKLVFQNKIIPLLKEYFYGDFGKLGLVLGEGFFESTGTSDNSLFAKFGDFDSSDFNERVVYKFKTISSNDETLGMDDAEFFKAISQLLNS